VLANPGLTTDVPANSVLTTVAVGSRYVVLTTLRVEGPPSVIVLANYNSCVFRVLEIMVRLVQPWG
jgi:hypothetical protein